jgi:hypothetical protein
MPCGEHATNVKGPAHALVSTSPHAPRLRPRLLSLVAIRFTILIPLSVITGATVFTIKSISPAVRRSQGPRDLHRRAPNHRHCGDVYSRAPRAQTHCTSLPCRPLELEAKAPSDFTAAHCASTSSPLLMHPPFFAHTQLIPLLQPQHELSHSRQHSRALGLPSLQSCIATSLAALVRDRHSHSPFT